MGFDLGWVFDDMFVLCILLWWVVVVGGGYVVVEFVGLLWVFGCEVSLLVCGLLLVGFDVELIDVLVDCM